MGSSVQLNLPPTAVNRVGATTPTAANSDSATVDLASVVLSAGDRLGLADKDLAGIFDLSAPDFSSAFSPHRLDRNRLMKIKLPDTLAREVARVMGERTGLVIGGPDAERHAVADLMVAAAGYLRVVQR
jgi:hypothetical protein